MKYEKELPQRHFDVFGFVLRRLEVEKLSSKNSEISTPKVPTTFLPRVPRTYLQTPSSALHTYFCSCIYARGLEYQKKVLYTGTVFENHRKSLIQHCARSELRLHFEWTKVN